ncbi:12554_t:CDS:2, partial [Rhizophagus irregularis]
YRDIQMKDYIQERCDDLMNNKKKMINSFMNREIKSIVIDQVIVTENNDDVLITDPQSIKKRRSTNQEKILSGIWIDQYSPRNYVDENIYDGLIDHITQEEIEYHISLLPNGKASGPSRVSYKMIKHSSSEMKTYIKDYLNECLTLKKIPK